MTEISVAEVEARSGVEKEPGETVAEYLRRVGDRADVPTEDVEAVVTELQRQQFAGGTVAADDADAPIEAFLEAADDLGGDAGDPGGNIADREGPDEPEADAEDTGDGGTDAAAGAAASDSTAATDGADEEDPMAFYRSVAVLGVIVLLAGGVIGSAVLLGTDLGPSGDGPEASGDAGALDDAANGTEGGSDGGDAGNDSDDPAANGTETNETVTNGSAVNGSSDEDAASNGTPDGNASADDANDTTDTDGNGTPSDDGTDGEPIGFDGEVTNDTDAENGSDGGTGSDEDGNDSDGGTDLAAGDENGTDEPVGFGEGADGEDDDETEDADDEDGTDDPGAIDSAPEATGSLEVTDRAAPGDQPADEYVELTNVGDAPLDMSGWTVRDREGGAVDTHGLEPLEFPDGFVLEPGASVRLVTGDGEDTAETIYWGQNRQHWRSAGDVVVVRDADGETVIRHPYGDQA
ncbi:lamin tail domain-containing protein [Saliphagus sp. LR7]|uniref:lamin tail domain-containing protein n=1 Tax=Saliphagus sp. LR7 TaxID=2282654 RepID=UPI000DF8218D|nr:lamin tail domain-containing protein [Saliphagus sp. LR7]